MIFKSAIQLSLALLPLLAAPPSKIFDGRWEL